MYTNFAQENKEEWLISYFIGSNIIEEQIKSGIRKKMIGFKLIQKSMS